MNSSEASLFVGLSITRDRKEKMLFVSQPDYTKKILQRFEMDKCHPTNLPAIPGTSLSLLKDDGGTTKLPFKEAIGSLMYLMISS